ncbi:hypothetical protein MSP8887_00192 [Marinomonas spartinae]|uniref:hypothetical protein n=1 Tax=Marinomonas spartinae TaxID=1792290 RepID=UPI000808CB47|nr:hypothetical protein [Marinomonas spartinae]SBS25411.1 hypothetical protein MSP8887_00192 [Marinomonas spartinae]
MDTGYVLHAHSWIEANFYALELDKRYDNGNEIRDLIDDCKTLSRANRAINRSVKQVEDQTHTEVPLREIENSFLKAERLSDGEFLYLKTSYRACGFILTFLLKESRREILDDNRYNLSPFHDEGMRLWPGPKEYLKRPISLKLNIPRDGLRSLTELNSRYRLIRKIFLRSNINLKGQEYLFDLVTQLWDKCYSSSDHRKLVKWFDQKNPNQIESCIDYLSKNTRRFSLPWKPISENESYHALVAYFDYHLLMHPLETELTIKKMKASWNQKKFREKTKGKRPYSVSMTDRTKTRLTWLVEQDDSNISDVIKKLIDERYEKSR